jgi:arsenate reductase-like glutaredoxin family protein
MFTAPRSKILSLFYTPTCSKSRHVLQLVKDRVEALGPNRINLELCNVNETTPTSDQLENIASFLQSDQGAHVLLRPTTEVVEDAVEYIRAAPASRLQRPILVDWQKGKALIARPPLTDADIGAFIDQMA